MAEYWINHWVGMVAVMIAGFALGYLYREKRLWDHKKGGHK